MIAVEVAVCIGFVVVLCMTFRDIGYEQGREQGRKEAYAEQDNWWFTAEEQVDEARKQIWREEPKKGGRV